MNRYRVILSFPRDAENCRAALRAVKEQLIAADIDYRILGTLREESRYFWDLWDDLDEVYESLKFEEGLTEE